MALGDIYRIFVRFNDSQTGKERFAVEIRNINLAVVVLDTITSKYQKKSEFIQLQYYPIIDWREAGLTKPSFIDIQSGQNYAIEEILKNGKYTGCLTDRDIRGLISFMQSYTERLRAFKNGK